MKHRPVRQIRGRMRVLTAEEALRMNPEERDHVHCAGCEWPIMISEPVFCFGGECFCSRRCQAQTSLRRHRASQERSIPCS